MLEAQNTITNKYLWKMNDWPEVDLMINYREWNWISNIPRWPNWDIAKHTYKHTLSTIIKCSSDPKQL